VTPGLARICAIAASATLFAVAARIEQPTAALVWIALVPWLASLERERSVRAAMASALLMSTTFVVVVFA